MISMGEGKTYEIYIYYSIPGILALPMISMRLSKISGADEPRAISVRLATVGFQTCVV